MTHLLLTRKKNMFRRTLKKQIWNIQVKQTEKNEQPGERRDFRVLKKMPFKLKLSLKRCLNWAPVKQVDNVITFKYILICFLKKVLLTMRATNTLLTPRETLLINQRPSKRSSSMILTVRWPQVRIQLVSCPLLHFHISEFRCLAQLCLIGHNKSLFSSRPIWNK